MGKFNTIGLIVPDLQNPFYANLAETLETEIARHGYDLILESSRADVVREADHLRSMANKQVDGMVCILAKAISIGAWRTIRIRKVCSRR